MNISRWARSVDSRWYLGVRCKKCRVPILFALDLSEGEKEVPVAAASKLVLTCSIETCKHRDDYSGAAVSRFQNKPQTPDETKGKSEVSKSRKPKR